MKKFILGTLISTMLLSQSVFAGTILNFNSNATVEKDPDIAYFTSSIEAQGETNEEAKEIVTEKFEDLSTNLLDSNLGIEKDDIIVDRISFYPEYNYSKDIPELISYRASYSFKVVIEEMENLDLVLDELAKSDYLSYSNLSFGLKNDDALYEEALIEATEIAVAKAENFVNTFFSGYDFSIVSISEGSVNYSEPILYGNYDNLSMDSTSSKESYSNTKIKTTAYVNLSVEVDN